MNKLDLDYQNLLQDILDNGIEKKDRTGTGTISVFGRQIRHKMSDGFPLLTTKKVHFKSVVTELLWFLRGDTNIKYLVDNDCHIWDGDAYKNYEKITNSFQIDNPIDDFIIKTLRGEMIKIETEDGDDYRILTKEEFINKIKTDDEFAKKWGELGPIYGKQWRSWHWRSEPVLPEEKYMIYTTEGKPVTWSEEKYIDQIANLINNLKTNPDSRRLMVSAWNVGELDQMVLPPCHYGFQVYTRELTWEERSKLLDTTNGPWDSIAAIGTEMDRQNLPKRAISLMWNQRSVDTFLGLPFNIASYGLLLEIIAKEVNMVPDELIGNLGDVHLYSNHVEQAKEQIGRKLTVEERMDWWFKNHKPNRDVCDYVDELSSYAKGVYFDSVKVPKSTREPFDLPKLVINENNQMIVGGGIFTYVNTDFTLENYQSHPTIKAPLSN